MLVDTPDLDKAGSKRSSMILQEMGDREDIAAGPSANFDQKSTSDQRLSAFLRNESGTKHSPTASRGSQPDHSEDNTPSSERPPRPSFMTSTQSHSPANDSNSPGNAVARADIRASAEKILYTYLLAGSEREIILPVGILDNITQSIEQEGRDDPEVFDGAKDYVFQAMERDAFPGFLRAKALGNIVQPSMMLRLIIGLLALFAAFWAAFVLIFLDYSRKTRCWVSRASHYTAISVTNVGQLILPFAVGVYFLASHQYMLDPILALLGMSEYTFMSFQRVKEPFVRKLLNKRALMCMGIIFLVTAVLCLLFILVPGKRL